MEIKILCPCGTKFKFDVQPVNGESPGFVRCPGCGQDRTEATNAQIKEKLSPARVSVAAVAPAPSVPTSGGAVPAVRIPVPASMKVSVPTPPFPSSAAAPAAVAAPTPPAPTPVTAPPGPVASAAATVAPPAPGAPKMAFMPAPAEGGKTLSVAGAHKAEEPSSHEGAAVAAAPMAAHPATAKMVKAAVPAAIRVKAGVIGAIVGGLVGMIAWYFIVITTGNEAKWLAIMVGTLAGWGARLLGGGKHPTLATAAGFSAIVGIAIGQFLAIAFIMAQFVDEIVEESYKARITIAKEAVNARTDDQVRAIMVKDEDYDEFFEEDPKEIEEEDVAEYRKKELPELQKFAKGTPSRTQYETQIRAQIDESGMAKYHFDPKTIVWIVAGITVAWKIVKPDEKE